MVIYPNNDCEKWGRFTTTFNETTISPGCLRFQALTSETSYHIFSPFTCCLGNGHKKTVQYSHFIILYQLKPGWQTQTFLKHAMDWRFWEHLCPEDPVIGSKVGTSSHL